MTPEQAPSETHLGQYAGFITRLIAYGIDRLVVAGILGILAWFVQLVVQNRLVSSLLQDSELVRLVALVTMLALAISVPIAYHLVFWTLAGITPGKWFMGVRIVQTDGTRVRLITAVRRQVGYWISGILYLGYLWILVDDRRQGFHDKIAGTLVVYSWPEVEPVAPIMDRLRSLGRRRQAASGAEQA